MTPDDFALALLAASGMADLDAPPIDAEAIAIDHLDLDVQEHADLSRVPGAPEIPRGVTLSGLLLPAKRRIWVNSSETRRSEGRRMFTIAHEIGHWQMHRDVGGGAHARFCRADQVDAARTALNLSPQLEREANRFAAALLMPPALVRREHGRLGTNVPELATRFGVSTEAMLIRLETLRLLPDYLL